MACDSVLLSYILLFKIFRTRKRNVSLHARINKID